MSGLVNLLPDGVQWWIDPANGSLMVLDSTRGWSEDEGRWRCAHNPEQARRLSFFTYNRSYLPSDPVCAGRNEAYRAAHGRQHVPDYEDVADWCGALAEMCNDSASDMLRQHRSMQTAHAVHAHILTRTAMRYLASINNLLGIPDRLDAIWASDDDSSDVETVSLAPTELVVCILCVGMCPHPSSHSRRSRPCVSHRHETWRKW